MMDRRKERHEKMKIAANAFLGGRSHVSQQAQNVIDAIVHDFAFLMRSLIFASSFCNFVMTAFPDLVMR